jgi:plastocyanin
MSIKKWVAGMVVILAVVMAAGSLGALAAYNVGVQTGETVKAIEVELNDDYFNPKDITIQNETTTSLILKNKGQKLHTFTVEKLGIDAEVQPGKEVTITVTPKQSGTYELICRYHFQQGMIGKIIVE